MRNHLENGMHPLFLLLGFQFNKKPKGATMLSKNLHTIRVLLSSAVIVSAIFAIPVAITAQTVTGTMQGTVSDTNGAVVPGVTVVIRNTETGQERTVTTNNEGVYQASFLPIGRYDVTASSPGFGTVKRENIDVTLNNTVVPNFTLDPSVTVAVTVTDEAATINTTNAEVKGSLTAQEILDKPTANQGNFLTLAETFTGFQENPTSGQNNPTLSSGSSINFNGTGTRGATFQINGVNNDDSSENQNRQGASLSTIKEFQVITNNFSAEFGRGYGAVVLVQTKSGTNKVRGEIYEYHNDSALNAGNFFRARDANGVLVKKPVNRRNQYGFVTGFPIFRDKLFGFVSFDQVRRTGAGSYTRDVLLPNERDGSQLFKRTPANDTPANRAFINSVIARFPASLVPNDARSNRTYSGQAGFDQPLDDYSGRFDWNPRSSDTLFTRFQYTRQIFDNEDNIIGEATRQNNKQRNLGVTWTHIFTGNTVGEFRYGLGLRTTLVGIKAGNDTPIIRFSPSPVSGSIIGNAGAFPINRYQTDNQFVYNVSTLFLKNHFFKAGTDIRRQQLDDNADNFSRGFYTFRSACGGTTYASPYEAFLNGCVNAFQKGYGPFFLENRINESNFYAEDNWKVRSNLTLNIGARYEYVSAPREIRGRINYGFGADKNNIEPRVGFAYSPGWKEGIIAKLTGGPGNSSLRGGYGIYHGRIFQSVFSQSGATVRFNPPNAFFLSVTNQSNLIDPTNGFVFTPGPQTARHSETRVEPNLQMPYTQQWSLSVERQLPFRSALRLTYTGNRGIGLLRLAQENLPAFSSSGVLVVNDPNNAPTALYSSTNRGAGDPRGVDVRGMVLRLAADAQCAGTGLPGVAVNALCPVPVTLAPNEFSVRVPRTDERRPDPRFSTNVLISNNTWSYYNGLQAEWNKKQSRGLTFQMSYTFSKSIDTNSEASFVGAGDTNANGPNARLSRALSRFDTRHRFTVYSTYLLPFFRHRSDLLGQALGGWQFSTVVKLATGTPFTVTNSNGFGDLNFDGFAELRPALLDPSVLGAHVNNPNTSQQLLTAAAFGTPTASNFGSILGRNTFYADGVKNVDFGLYKAFQMPFNERHRVLLRADFFNAFNHVQYGFPVTDLASSNFGRILGTATQYNPRNVQFSLRYQF
ncbi:MAG: carboxypeptidase regulatory-like domain-containing protein [Pyrinomonadaceae bacterium]